MFDYSFIISTTTEQILSCLCVVFVIVYPTQSKTASFLNTKKGNTVGKIIFKWNLKEKCSIKLCECVSSLIAKIFVQMVFTKESFMMVLGKF